MAAPNDVVPVGTVLCYILQEGETAPEVAPRGDGVPIPVPETAAGARPAPAAAASAPAGASKRVRISPRARRLADELGIDISTIVPGKPGRIVEADVQRAAETQPTPAANIESLHGIRKVVAERMAHSFTTVPHFYLTVESNASALLAWHEQTVAESGGAEPTLTDVLVKIVAHALSEHPRVNSAWHEKGIESHDSVNVGIATDTDEGLVVPVLKQAVSKSVAEISNDRRQLIENARIGKLSFADLEGGTFTLSNLGMFGIDAFDAIINTPQSAILAVGRIKERPVAENGTIVARPTLIMTLSADHRVIDGAAGARFLARVDELIQDPTPLQS